MRHRVSSKRLKRTSGELKALLKNQASQLFERGSVTTTLPKAKILRPFADLLEPGLLLSFTVKVKDILFLVFCSKVLNLMFSSNF